MTSASCVWLEPHPPPGGHLHLILADALHLTRCGLAPAWPLTYSMHMFNISSMSMSSRQPAAIQ